MSKLKSLNKFTVTNIKCYGMVIIAFAILYPMLQADMISNKISGLLIPICAYVVMAISLNLTVGFLGELSLGHAGFMSVGAFSGVIPVACMQDGMPAPVKLLIAIIIGGIMAGILGLIIGIPVIRLKGDYLAIVTLAFGEIIKNIINCVYVGLDGSGLHFSMKSAEALGMDAGKMILNGPQGAVSISKISTFTAGILLILFSLFVVLNLVNSKTGRAVTAIRDNRIAAESVGINITKYKLTAFIISAIIAGMAATEVKGVASMAGNIKNELVAKMGMKSLSKGVKVEVTDTDVKVDLTLILKFEANILAVSGAVQEKVN